MSVVSPSTISMIEELVSLEVSDETLAKVVREVFSKPKTGSVTFTSALNTANAHHNGVANHKTNHKNNNGDNNDGVMVEHEKNIIIEVFVHGKRSTVSLSNSLFEKLISLQGSEAGARKYVRDTMLTMPSDVDKKSAWIKRHVEML